MSDHIGKGKRWLIELARNLQDCDVGIVLLTQSSGLSPWVNFEAGAIAGNVGCGRIFTLELEEIVGHEPSLPVMAFRRFAPTLSGMTALLGQLAELEPSLSSDKHALEEALEQWLPVYSKFWEGLGAIPTEKMATDAQSLSSGIEEVLERTVALYRESKALLLQTHVVVDYLNACRQVDIQKQRPPPVIKGMAMPVCESTLPDGSRMRDARWPEGRNFQSWTAYRIATARDANELNRLLHDEGL